jgi:hypothetical protein
MSVLPILPGAICVGAICDPALSASVSFSCPTLSVSVPSFTQRYLRLCSHPARRYLRRCHPLPGAICVGVLFLPDTICVGVVLFPALSASVLSFCPALSASVPSFTRRCLRRCPFPARHYLCRCCPFPGAICVVFSSCPALSASVPPSCPALSASVPYFYPALVAPTLSFHLALPASVPSPYPTVSVSVSSFTQCYLCWFLLLPSALRVGTFILPGALGIGASPSYHVYRRSASAPSFITALCITSLINTFYSALLLPVPRHHFINPSTLCVDVFIIASCILALAVSRPSLLSYHTALSVPVHSCILVPTGQVLIIISFIWALSIPLRCALYFDPCSTSSSFYSSPNLLLGVLFECVYEFAHSGSIYTVVIGVRLTTCHLTRCSVSLSTLQ